MSRAPTGETETSHAISDKKEENAVDAKQLQSTLEKAKTQRAKLSGQREQLIRSLKDLGHDSPESVQREIDELEEFIRTTEPSITEQYDAFIREYGDIIQTL